MVGTILLIWGGRGEGGKKLNIRGSAKRILHTSFKAFILPLKEAICNNLEKQKK